MKKNILVVRLSSLGDVILTSATVLNLKVNFPGSHIVYLTKERYKPLVGCFEGIDEIMALPQSAGSIDHFKLALKLDEYNFDTIIDLHGNFRSWFARKIIAANVRCVYPKRRIERLRIVKRHRLPAAWPHTIDLYNNCVEQLEGRVVCKRPIMKPPVVEEEISSILKPVENKRNVVVIAPGAAHPNKQWPMERFTEVAMNLHRSHGAVIVWAVTATDRVQPQLEGKISADHFLELVDYPVDKLAGVIARADLTIANDSGIAHLSSAVGTPVVALFGPTHPALGFAPRGLFDRVVEVDEFCRPCSLHGKKECYRDKRYCFTRITPEMVYEAARDLLDSSIKSSRALFVDRDGTIMIDKNFLSDPDEIEFVSGSVEALRLAKAMGYKLIVLSNQSGVARGFFGLDTVERINERFHSMLSAEGVQVDALYYCPHLVDGAVEEFAIQCDCRKPAPAMAEEAARRLGIDLRRSYVIGDKIDDVNLARVIGARSFLVRTGHGREQEQQLKTHGINNDREAVCDDLQSAMEQIRAIEGT
jgi:D,D-heptose 1,7-bisphosphate phosphatase